MAYNIDNKVMIKIDTDPGPRNFNVKWTARQFPKQCGDRQSHRQPEMNSQPTERTIFHASSAQASSHSTVRLI